MIERPYQQSAGLRCEELWSAGTRSVLVVSPVASGKTLIGTRRIRDRRVLWVAPRREIVKDTADRIRQSTAPETVGVILGGVPRKRAARVQVASVQSLLERGLHWEWDLTVLDEAHHYLAAEWREVTRLNPNPNALTLGLTATPRRADGTELGDIFDELVNAAQYSQLIREGYVVPTRVLRPASYLDGDMAWPAYEAYLRYGENRRAILFESSVAGAKQTVQELRRYRVAAGIIHYGMSHVERDHTIDRFRRGDLRVISNVFAISEGFDAPAASCAVLTRAFATPEAMIQACGRVMRPSDGKTDGLVLDLTGCTHRNGLPDDDREWELRKTAPRAGGPSREATERSDPERSILGLGLVSVDGSPVPSAALPEPETRIETIARIARERQAAASVRRKHSPRQVEAREAARARFEKDSEIPDGDLVSDDLVDDIHEEMRLEGLL